MLMYKTSGNPIPLNADKITEGLECCTQESCPVDRKCPYSNKQLPGTCQLKLMNDALMLIRVLMGQDEEE